MSNCIYLKLKLNRTLFCKKLNKLINISECKECDIKDFISRDNSKIRPIKKGSYKQYKKEKERYSIIYKNLTMCAECGSNYNVQRNEVYEGAKRGISILHGFVVPLCDKCHKQFHKNRFFALKYKIMFQKEYEKKHSHEEFMKIIHYNYLSKEATKKRTGE